MIISFPLWYKIILGLAGILVITGITRRLSKNKTIDAITSLPEERIEKLTKASSAAIKIHKIFLLATPLYLILIPCLTYIYTSDYFFHITSMLLIMYVFIIEDYFYRRSLIKIINNKK